MKISKRIRLGCMAAACAGGIALPMTGEASVWGAIFRGVAGAVVDAAAEAPTRRYESLARKAERNVELSPYMQSMELVNRGHVYEMYAQTRGITIEEAARLANEESWNTTIQLGGETYSYEEYLQMKEDAEAQGLVLADDGNTYTHEEMQAMWMEQNNDFLQKQNAAAQELRERGGVGTVAVYQGHRYYLYLGGCATWEEARDQCEALGGHLVTIENAAENIAVHTYVTRPEQLPVMENIADGMAGKNGMVTFGSGNRSMTFSSGVAPTPGGSMTGGLDMSTAAGVSVLMTNKAFRRPYIGLYLDGGQWKWVDGTPVTYTNWHKGKAGTKEEKPYARFIDSMSGKGTKQFMKNHDMSAMAAWEADSFKNGAFICEWDGPNESIPKLPEKDVNMYAAGMRGADASHPMATSDLMSYEEMQKRMPGVMVPTA